MERDSIERGERRPASVRSSSSFHSSQAAINRHVPRPHRVILVLLGWLRPERIVANRIYRYRRVLSHRDAGFLSLVPIQLKGGQTSPVSQEHERKNNPLRVSTKVSSCIFRSNIIMTEYVGRQRKLDSKFGRAASDPGRQGTAHCVLLISLAFEASIVTGVPLAGVSLAAISLAGVSLAAISSVADPLTARPCSDGSWIDEDRGDSWAIVSREMDVGSYGDGESSYRSGRGWRGEKRMAKGTWLCQRERSRVHVTHRVPAARRRLRLAPGLFVELEFLGRRHFIARDAGIRRGFGLVRGHCD